MKTALLAAVAAIALAGSAQAETHKWYILDYSDAKCHPATEPTKSPDAVHKMLRSNGIVDQIEVSRADDGSVTEADVESAPLGKDIVLRFFSTMNGCQVKLAEEVTDGNATPTDDLK